MDLSTLDLRKAADKGATMTLRHPVTDEDTDIKITVLGSDSVTFRSAVSRLEREFGGKKKRPTIAEQERRTVDLLVAVTTGWENIDWDGKPLAFSADNAQMLYTERHWIREQVDAFMSDRGNYSPSA